MSEIDAGYFNEKPYVVFEYVFQPAVGEVAEFVLVVEFVFVVGHGANSHFGPLRPT